MTWPLLRPEAPKPISAASSTVQAMPWLARYSAAESPVKPAPMTATSVRAGPSNGVVGGAGGAVAAHRLGGIAVVVMPACWGQRGATASGQRPASTPMAARAMPAFWWPTPGTLSTRQAKGAPSAAAWRRARSKKCQPRA